MLELTFYLALLRICLCIARMYALVSSTPSAREESKREVERGNSDVLRININELSHTSCFIGVNLLAT